MQIFLHFLCLIQINLVAVLLSCGFYFVGFSSASSKLEIPSAVTEPVNLARKFNQPETKLDTNPEILKNAPAETEKVAKTEKLTTKKNKTTSATTTSTTKKTTKTAKLELKGKF